jgi:hypothetical protein
MNDQTSITNQRSGLLGAHSRDAGKVLPAEAGVPTGTPALAGSTLRNQLPASRECARYLVWQCVIGHLDFFGHWSLVIGHSDGRPTAVELATPRAQIFSLSPRPARRSAGGGTSGERVGERGIPMVTRKANRKQDGPPLPRPLLPRWEEREDISLLSSTPFPNSTAVPPRPH